MIPDDHRYRYRYRYRSYTDTYTDTYTETNTDTDMLRRTSNRQPVCKLRYARARGNQSATSNAYKQLLGCFAGIIWDHPSLGSSEIISSEIIWYHLVSLENIWHHLESSRLGSFWDPPRIIWNNFGSSVTIWDHLGSSGAGII